MRLDRRFAGALALTTAAAIALTGCTKKNESPEAGASGGAGGKTYKVAFVPKLQGVPYFEAMNAGGEQAAQALGNVEWLYQGPTQADAAAQADIVRSYIQQKVDALIVAPYGSTVLPGSSDTGKHARSLGTRARRLHLDARRRQGPAEDHARHAAILRIAREADENRRQLAREAEGRVRLHR